MNVLFTSMTALFNGVGGLETADRTLVKELVGRGHRVHVITHKCRKIAGKGRVSIEPWTATEERLARMGATFRPTECGMRIAFAGYEAHALDDSVTPEQIQGVIKRSAFEMGADCVAVSSAVGAPGVPALRGALATGRPVTLLMHSVGHYPFGPDSLRPSEDDASLFRQAARVATVSRYVAQYAARHGGLQAVPIPLNLFGQPPFPVCSKFGSGHVTFVNPSPSKGAGIFIAVAKALPKCSFAIVAGWSTTHELLAELSAMPNVTVLNPTFDFESILASTSIVLFPSIAPEGFPRTVVESMLRGLPVVSSAAGGTKEAKLGSSLMLPTDEARPWIEAVERLTVDRHFYEECARDALDRSLRYAASIGIEPLEGLLAETVRREQRVQAPPADQP